VLEGAKENGFEISEVFLNEAGITPCVGCLKCQTGESTGCSVQDGFHEVIDRIREADLVIIGSPVYTCQVTAQTKMFLDRLYSLPRHGHPKSVDGFTKKGVTITTLGGGAADGTATKRMLRVLFEYLGTKDVSEIVAPGVFHAGAISKYPDVIAKAKQLGADLARNLSGTG
jgi:multimeric flavodoxin WrbA